MSWVEWIGVISGILAIVGAIVALGKRYAIPYLRKQIYQPIDPSQPVRKNALCYKDVPNAIALVDEKIRVKHPDVILGIDRGGAIVGGLLAKRLRIPIRLLYRIKSDEGFYSDFGTSELDGKIVVLVDDASRRGALLKKQ
jgi:ethanolamine utilization protein EutA (predicted chaperonin)